MSNQEQPFDFMLHTKLNDFCKGTGKIVSQTAAEREAAELRQIAETEKVLNEMGLSMRTESNLQRIVDAFREENPDRIILFGSRAYGHPRPNSDYDICVIKHIEAVTVDERNDEYYRLRQLLSDACPGVPIDLALFTPEDFEDEKDICFYVAYDISRKGIVLYDRISNML